MHAPDTDLDGAADTLMRESLTIRPGEEAIVICDEATRELADVFWRSAQRAGADAALTIIAHCENEAGREPPACVAAAMAAADVFIAATTRSLSYTEARRRATEAGTRGATMPAVTADMLARMMNLDFSVMAARSRAIAKALTDGAQARVTCPRGTDLAVDLVGRDGIADDGDLSASAAWGNLPCGEAFISPTGGEGVLVVESIAGLGRFDPPARLVIENGSLAAGDARFTRLLDAHGPAGRNLAELGVGTNDRAELTGNVLEDEKILGTVHVAFGASLGIGGTIEVPVHLDCVVLAASLHIDGVPVLDAGEIVESR